MTDVIELRSPAVRGLVVLVVLVLVVAVALAGRAVLDKPSRLDRAIAELDDDDAFSRASDAGTVLLGVSRLLEDAAEACDESGPRCGDLFTAAALSRVGAVGVLRCGRPEIFEFRHGLRDFLLAIDAADAATAPAPPTC